MEKRTLLLITGGLLVLAALGVHLEVGSKGVPRSESCKELGYDEGQGQMCIFISRIHPRPGPGAMTYGVGLDWAQSHPEESWAWIKREEAKLLQRDADEIMKDVEEHPSATK